MRTKIEEPETTEVHNHSKTVSDVLFLLVPSGFPNDKLAISDCWEDDHWSPHYRF